MFAPYETGPSSMPYEYSISLDDWISRFPLASHREAVRDISYISGPFDLAIVEQAWRENRKSVGIDADVFIFAVGEPQYPHVTKIGGLPYRPEGKPWPICTGAPAGTASNLVEYYKPRGTPMCFLAQFCFTGSRDIVGELPGDVLLLFTEDDSFATDLYFEWYPIGIQKLVSPSQVPDGASPFNKAYGFICRVQEPVELLTNFPFVSKTKIGGKPDFIQTPSQSSGRFLCQLSSMQPTFKRPFPWVGRETPVTEFDDLHSNELCMVDMGNIYVYIGQDGSCSSVIDTY